MVLVYSNGNSHVHVSTDKAEKVVKRNPDGTLAINLIREIGAQQFLTSLPDLRQQQQLGSEPNAHPYLTLFTQINWDLASVTIEMPRAICDLRYILMNSIKVNQRQLALQLLAAVKFIHTAGVLHRDLKPDNILLFPASKSDQGLQLRLADFGSARAVVSDQSRDQTKEVYTQYYRAPEVRAGQLYNFKADVWATGCVLVELLGNQSQPLFVDERLYQPAQLESRLNAILGQESPYRGEAALDRSFRTIVKSMLKLDQATRIDLKSIKLDGMAALVPPSKQIKWPQSVPAIVIDQMVQHCDTLNFDFQTLWVALGLLSWTSTSDVHQAAALLLAGKNDHNFSLQKLVERGIVDDTHDQLNAVIQVETEMVSKAGHQLFSLSPLLLVDALADNELITKFIDWLRQDYAVKYTASELAMMLTTN